ncbi:hypothetical protein LTS18_006117 [Coniosporium uncinatum]|uniref:Uncharacterized protein n=1 Tax=Coniosporium uncinatum TaxID=93489 RepID=A0ACC3DQS3_9PEZI|nr:hypothetical protein LTS18_006117 [Coniosporium uncinatum]
MSSVREHEDTSPEPAHPRRNAPDTEDAVGLPSSGQEEEEAQESEPESVIPQESIAVPAQPKRKRERTGEEKEMEKKRREEVGRAREEKGMRAKQPLI